jgi:hypothetical protein
MSIIATSMLLLRNLCWPFNWYLFFKYIRNKIKFISLADGVEVEIFIYLTFRYYILKNGPFQYAILNSMFSLFSLSPFQNENRNTHLMILDIGGLTNNWLELETENNLWVRFCVSGYLETSHLLTLCTLYSTFTRTGTWSKQFSENTSCTFVTFTWLSLKISKDISISCNTKSHVRPNPENTVDTIKLVFVFIQKYF